MENKGSDNKLGFFGLYVMGLGYVIGTGIFNMLPSTIGKAGHSVSLAMLFGCFLALVQTIPSIFLSSVKNMGGGMYSLNTLLFKPKVGRVIGVVQLLSSISFASFCIGLANYTIDLIPGLAGYHKLVTLGFMFLFLALGIRGVKDSSRGQTVMVAVLVAALGVYIIFGLPRVNLAEVFSGEDFFAGGVRGFFSSACLLSLSAMGGMTLINFTNMSKNPKRNIPLAIICSTLTVCVFYFLIALVTSGAVDYNVVAAAGSLGAAAATFLSTPLYMFFMIGGALFALGTTLNGRLASVSTPYLRMAEEGVLPKFFGLRDRKFNYPYGTMAFITVAGGILPIVFGLDIATIASMFMFPGFLITGAQALAALSIPKRYPDAWKASPYHVPYPVYVVLMLVSAVASFFVGFNYIGNLTIEKFVIIVAVVIAIVLFITYRRKKGYLKDVEDEE